MGAKDFAKQLASMQSVGQDAEDEFDEIVAITQVPVSVGTKVVPLPIDRLVEYSDENFENITGRPQPFKLHSTEHLDSLAKSIAEHGVIHPITVRPLPGGIYQILAGRNRKRASVQCGKTTIPAIIREDIDDVEAAMIMLDTNLEQRPSLAYSEKAYAYKMRVELQRQQGKRTDLEGGERKDALREVGKDLRDSRRTVAYLIRLTSLIPALLEVVDEGKIGFKLGVALSYLSKGTQERLWSEVLPQGVKLKMGDIQELRQLEEGGTVSLEAMREVFFKTPRPVSPSITITGAVLEEYADILADKQEIERLFLEFLKTYRRSLTH